MCSAIVGYVVALIHWTSTTPCLRVNKGDKGAVSSPECYLVGAKLEKVFLYFYAYVYFKTLEIKTTIPDNISEEIFPNL